MRPLRQTPDRTSSAASGTSLERDTNADGPLDGNDSLPQVIWTAVMGDRARALGAVLNRISGMKSMAIIHEIPTSGDTLDDLMARARRATLTDERTTFLVADRRDFRSLVTTMRAVVLTADERRGFVVWDASRVGGSLRLRRTGSEWESETVGDWIT